jgi:type IV pilus assembly protein PilV
MESMTTTRKSQQGVMLIEALIGILIFSLGILAIMGLQAAAIKNTIEAKYRTEASFLTNRLIAEMWTECGVTCTNLSSFDTGSGTNPKMTNWRNEVAAKLPGIVVGAANSPTVTVAGNTVTVTVFWIMPGADATKRQFRSIALVNSAV